ncbi:hypothetical protein MF271_13105 [Deinococcus sp. KNUC1210]|uniref:hypothetical protein n=1 Tax=Deinococcus sp. KNUC1210 TaxID=2917691 RepID=UPI001EF0CA2F|nr:hypothetical protein [Deinococcus sp. KNUC1210]ULH14905.1 hypothetical protein MF271_13105 [Deinococcus sp. KNUC1210]
MSDARTFELRAVRKPQDFAALAALQSASNPEWPVTPELLQIWDDAFDPALFREELVAQQQERLIALGSVSHNDFAYEPWRYRGRVTVHPDERNRGSGRRCTTNCWAC